jgi:hypothetical protein
MKVYCKKCDHIRDRGYAHTSVMKCSEVKKDTYYEQVEGDPTEINLKNNCKHFKEKIKRKRIVWHRYWFSSPWWGM